MSRITTLATLLLLPVLTACGTTANRTSDQPKPIVSKIALHDVPQAARSAAEHQVPGIYIHSANVIRHPVREVYELKGLSHHTHYEIYVTGEGQILEIDHDSSLSD